MAITQLRIVRFGYNLVRTLITSQPAQTFKVKRSNIKVTLSSKIVRSRERIWLTSNLVWAS